MQLETITVEDLDVSNDSPNGGAKAKQETAAQIISSGPPDDLVRLTARHVDFGDDPFDANLSMPLTFGVLDWGVSRLTVQPVLTGKVYMNDSRGREAKIQMRFFDIFGTELQDARSESFIPTSDGLQSWAVDFSPYSNPTIEKVEVSILVRKDSTSWWVYARNEYTS